MVVLVGISLTAVQIQNRIVPNAVSISPTPTPPSVKIFESSDKSFKFLYPKYWSVDDTVKSASASATQFSACEGVVLTVSEIPDQDPVTKERLTAAKYLGVVSGATYSSVDGHKALMVSDEATESAEMPFSIVAIEATGSAKIIELRYQPSCNITLETGKTYEFLPLLRSLVINK